MLPVNVYNVSQIRTLERLSIDHFQLPEFTLMQRAGHAALLTLKQCWPHARYITVVCGSGNNGGDGYVLAYLAHQLGLHVVVQHIGSLEALTGAAKQALTLCQKHAVHIQPFEQSLVRADVVVDALLGMGLSGEVQAPHANVIEAINQQAAPVFAIDIPSGLNADTGRPQGVAVEAQATCTFIGLKAGMMTGKGLALSGKVFCDSLQIPKDVFDQVIPIGQQTVYDAHAKLLKKRKRDAHKGNFGHVLIVGGAPALNGAVRLAAEAALRTGAGLVSVATHPEHAALINCVYPEIMSHPIQEAKQLKPLLEKATVIVLGPGLGQTSWSKKCWRAVIDAKQPMVVDADGLNLLSQYKKTRDNWILTPHAGEAARLLGCEAVDIEANRIAAVMQLQQRYGGISVLKGAGSLVYTQQAPIAFCTDGNPGMASGGMGDLLTGVMAGLLANGVPLKIAATQGVCLHAHAGDIAARAGEYGLLASDLLPILKQLIN